MSSKEVVKYTNEQVRPMAEKLRGLKAEIDAALLQWHSGIGAELTADLSTTIDDGREAEGISRLTANDCVNLIAILESLQAELGQVGKAQIISKPCVRPLRVG
jgi:hypothetical protein